MVRKLPALLAALVAAIGAGALAVTLSAGSSHREAPLTSIDPTADDTDVYAFKAPDAPNALTIVANWIPFEDPAGGPNFYRFDDRASYYLNVDNTGDGRFDVRYRFKFKTKVAQQELVPVRAAGRLVDPRPEAQRAADLLGRARVVPQRQGDRSHGARHRPPGRAEQRRPEDVPELRRRSPARRSRHLNGGGRVFVGQADDPFFVDLGTTFDAINIRNGTGNAGGGKDDLAGYNVHSVVLQVPETEVTRDRKAVAGAEGRQRRRRRLGVDEPRARRRVGARFDRHQRPRKAARRARTPARSRSAAWATRSSTRSSSRSGQKDLFNATQPSDDLKNFGKYVVSPELAKVINVLFPGLNVPETNRTDIVQALLTGHPRPDADPRRGRRRPTR